MQQQKNLKIDFTKVLQLLFLFQTAVEKQDNLLSHQVNPTPSVRNRLFSSIE